MVWDGSVSACLWLASACPTLPTFPEAFTSLHSGRILKTPDTYSGPLLQTHTTLSCPPHPCPSEAVAFPNFHHSTCLPSFPCHLWLSPHTLPSLWRGFPLPCLPTFLPFTALLLLQAENLLAILSACPDRKVVPTHKSHLVPTPPFTPFMPALPLHVCPNGLQAFCCLLLYEQAYLPHLTL